MWSKLALQKEERKQSSLVINMRLKSVGMGNSKGKRPVQSEGTYLIRLGFSLLRVYCKEWN